MWPHERGADPERKASGRVWPLRSREGGLGSAWSAAAQCRKPSGTTARNAPESTPRKATGRGRRFEAPRGSYTGPSLGLLVSLRAHGAWPSPVPAPGCAPVSYGLRTRPCVKT